MDNKLDTDINYIIQMSLNGDKKYQEILLNKLKPLLCKNIYLHWNSGDSIVEDLLQEGYIVVLDALKTFDENKKVHFLAYVKSKLKYFYMNYHKNMLQSTKHLSRSINKNENYIADSEENVEKKILETEEISLLAACINVLPNKDQQLIYSYYFDRTSIGDIARNLDISYRAACNRKSRIIKKLRKCVIRR